MQQPPSGDPTPTSAPTPTVPEDPQATRTYAPIPGTVADVADGELARAEGSTRPSVPGYEVLEVLGRGGKDPSLIRVDPQDPRSSASHFFPKVTDFGLAKRVEDSSGQRATGAGLARRCSRRCAVSAAGWGLVRQDESGYTRVAGAAPGGKGDP
jgi:hypothetical protein